MPDTALDLARNAASQIGMRDISALVGSVDAYARAMLVLLNRSGNTLARMRNTWGGGWAALTREHRFRTIAGEEEYQFPDDFQAIADGTVWDRSTYREARGPLSPQEWQQVRSGLIESNQITPNYRIRRGSNRGRRAFAVDPVPEVSEDMVLEYISDAWVVDADGGFANKVTADTDGFIYDADLIEMDIVWRFKQSRGLSFAAELAEFEIERDRRFAEDAGVRALVIGRRPMGGIGGANISETGFGVSDA